MKEQEFILTPEGYLELETELNELKTVVRPRIIKDLKDARAQGDLSENADYDSARDEQAQLEGRIKKIEQMLENYVIIEEVSKDKVGLGSTVVIKYMDEDDDDDEEDEYKIVGSQEADPFESRIPNESPIAQALFNHKVGDIVTVDSPNGAYQVEITAIQ